jgi:hypothetical protein
MKMKLILLILSISFTASAQTELYRSQYPIAAKIGFEGIGFDAAFGNYFAVDATTWVLYNSFKARAFFFEKNGSPFVGAGVGSFTGSFGGGGENKWTVFFVGWEQSYKVFLIQFFLQHPISVEYPNNYSPFFLNLNLGVRIH